MLSCKGYNIHVASVDWEGEAKMSSRAPAYEKQIVREIHATPKEYWPNLLQLVRLFRESVTLQPADASFRQGWREAKAGQTRPVSELWEGIDAE
jgi:hypothetical protein